MLPFTDKNMHTLPATRTVVPTFFPTYSSYPPAPIKYHSSTYRHRQTYLHLAPPQHATLSLTRPSHLPHPVAIRHTQTLLTQHSETGNFMTKSPRTLRLASCVHSRKNSSRGCSNPEPQSASCLSSPLFATFLLVAMSSVVDEVSCCHTGLILGYHHTTLL